MKSELRPLLSLPCQILVTLFFLSLTVLFAFASYVAGFIGTEGNYAHRCLTQWARVGLAVARLKVDIQGLERLDRNKTYIFMPNHTSFLDVLLLLAHLPYNFRFIIKDEFFSVPLVGAALRRCGNIPIDRKNPWKALKSLRGSADLLKQGISIVVFPEGSRSPNGAMQDLKSALFILPIRSQTPVVPVLIEGTFGALKRGRFLLNWRPLRMTFHDPIPADSFEVRDREAYAEKVRMALSAEEKREAGPEEFRL